MYKILRNWIIENNNTSICWWRWRRCHWQLELEIVPIGRPGWRRRHFPSPRLAQCWAAAGPTSVVVALRQQSPSQSRPHRLGREADAPCQRASGQQCPAVAAAAAAACSIMPDSDGPTPSRTAGGPGPGPGLTDSEGDGCKLQADFKLEPLRLSEFLQIKFSHRDWTGLLPGDRRCTVWRRGHSGWQESDSNFTPWRERFLSD